MCTCFPGAECGAAPATARKGWRAAAVCCGAVPHGRRLARQRRPKGWVAEAAAQVMTAAVGAG